eukprot:TRINITY_DN13888_c0_g1_i1.p1 TRINITY_DN13888_c0_g1~~TRINITY_DN13888_c0_g1_i1.p1  ORF type:complete len:303 (-),score=45.77 TRINITY_DN13888_c0_g1_i1:3-911(-)
MLLSVTLFAAAIAIPLVIWLKRHKEDFTKKNLAVVITGGSQGIGFSMAKEFLRLGDNVVIASRNPNEAAQLLSDSFKDSKIYGFAADVTSEQNLIDLAQFASEKLGKIDLWINNAGVTQPLRQPLVDVDVSVIRNVVDTNLVGAILGTKVALNYMKNQTVRGHIFTMDGAGSSGFATPNFAVYGATKSALPQFMKTIVKETKENNINVGVHLCSPGMVLTKLLLKPSSLKEPRILKVFNILCEQPDTVAKWLVPRLRGVKGTGRYIKYLTVVGAMIRFGTFWRYRNRFFNIKDPSKSKFKLT